MVGLGGYEVWGMETRDWGQGPGARGQGLGIIELNAGRGAEARLKVPFIYPFLIHFLDFFRG